MLINENDNHKSREYNTYTFAGLVKINGIDGVVGVVVKLTNTNKYKTHRIITPNDAELVFDNKKTTEAAAVGLVNEDQRSKISPVADTIKLNSAAEVNSKKFYSVNDKSSGIHV